MQRLGIPSPKLTSKSIKRVTLCAVNDSHRFHSRSAWHGCMACAATHPWFNSTPCPNLDPLKLPRPGIPTVANRQNGEQSGTWQPRCDGPVRYSKYMYILGQPKPRRTCLSELAMETIVLAADGPIPLCPLPTATHLPVSPLVALFRLTCLPDPSVALPPSFSNVLCHAGVGGKPRNLDNSRGREWESFCRGHVHLLFIRAIITQYLKSSAVHVGIVTAAAENHGLCSRIAP